MKVQVAVLVSPSLKSLWSVWKQSNIELGSWKVTVKARERSEEGGGAGLSLPVGLSFASGFNRLVFPGLCLCDSFVQCCLTSTETLRTIPPQRLYRLYLHRDLTDYTSTETLRAILHRDLTDYTSTETLRTVRAGEPRTSTSDFTQPLSSDL